jgi:D-beta-D-heptose 7-phosphate kinase/D-beta-D-heptose 1-phosphate adenosyltransferase
MKAYKDVLNRLQSSSVHAVELENHEIVSVIYHDIFDFPLNSEQLHRWTLNRSVLKRSSLLNEKIVKKGLGFYMLSGRKSIVVKSILRREISKKKRNIAERAAQILGMLPGIYMVAITGALAMENTDEGSDIDLMIITKKDRLWTNRILSWLVLKTAGLKVRRPKDDFEKNKLCLNIWMDESDLKWPKSSQNIFSAHEIAQIVPLVNKNNTYERFISRNIWIRKYWNRAVDYRKMERDGDAVTQNKRGTLLETMLSRLADPLMDFVEKAAFRLQYLYMKGKITRETVTATRALFHPVDWSRVVKAKMEKYVR